MFVHSKETGAPAFGVALVHEVVDNSLKSPARTLANIVGTPEQMAALEKIELVGRVGIVSHDSTKKKNWINVTNLVSKL